MYAPTFKHVHVPPEFLHFVERHFITSILVALIVLGSLFFLVDTLSPPRSFQELSSPSTPLILLNSPKHAHEFAVRTHYIEQQLQQLRLDTRADRAYALPIATARPIVARKT